MKSLAEKLTYANVMSTIAVFLVLGGGAAFAATQLAKNSVGTKQLKKNAVTTAKLKNNSVNGANVADGSLTGTEVADGSIGTADLTNAAVTTAKIGNDAVTSPKIAGNAVNSAKVQDKSLKGTDLGDDSVTGVQIDESTLGAVPDATKLNGKSSTSYVSSATYRTETAEEAGTQLGDGTYALSKSCNPGDVMLSGGPASTRNSSSVVESFPSGTNSWTVRIQKNGEEDNWVVVVLCADQ